MWLSNHLVGDEHLRPATVHLLRLHLIFPFTEGILCIVQQKEPSLLL
jgi:hypothetical protein